MKSIFLSLALSIILLNACNNGNSGDSVLTQPPFDKITDSISHSPKNADLYYRRAGLLYSNNLLNDALTDLRAAWNLVPKEEYALSITTLLKQKNADSAIIFLQEALKKLPQSIALKIGLARGFQQKNEWEKAMSVCEEILGKFPNQLDALVLKSDILKAQNKNNDALAVLEKAYSFAPMDKDLAYDLAYDYAEAKNPKAITLANILINLDSSETVARAFYIKGTYFSNMNNLSEAIKNYDAAILHDYNFLDAYLDKGKLLYNQKKYEAAQKIFLLALKVSPATAEFYFWLAKTQEGLGNKDEAKLNYQRAYGLNKSMTEARDAADRLF